MFSIPPEVCAKVKHPGESLHHFIVNNVYHYLITEREIPLSKLVLDYCALRRVPKIK